MSVNQSMNYEITGYEEQTLFIKGVPHSKECHIYKFKIRIEGNTSNQQLCINGIFIPVEQSLHAVKQTMEKENSVLPSSIQFQGDAQQSPKCKKYWGLNSNINHCGEVCSYSVFNLVSVQEDGAPVFRLITDY